MHNGRLITIFSASYYCGQNINKGAVIILNLNKDYEKNNELNRINLEIDTFFSEMIDNVDVIKRINENCERETIQQLRNGIYKFRNQLLNNFIKKGIIFF
jgi:hypothetical protein